MIGPNQLYMVQQQLGRCEGNQELSMSQLMAAHTPMELVRAMNGVLSVPSYLRGMSAVRRNEVKFKHQAERQCDQVMEKSIAALRGLMGTEDFCKKSIQLRQDLRHLERHFPRQVQIVRRDLDRLQHEIDQLPLPTIIPRMRS